MQCLYVCTRMHRRRVEQGNAFIHTASINTHSAYKVTCIEEKERLLSWLRWIKAPSMSNKWEEEAFCVCLSCAASSLAVLFCAGLLKLRDQIKTSGWGESVWLECKVATALRANVHAVRSCHSDQSLSTPSSPPVPIQLQPIHWIQSWPNTVHVESQIKYKSIHSAPTHPQQHFLTHPRCPQMGAHSNLPAGGSERMGRILEATKTTSGYSRQSKLK